MFPHMVVALMLIATAPVYAEELKQSSATRTDTSKTVAAEMTWQPFESVRATFPGAARPLFLYISQKGCSHCAYMDTAVFNRPEIIKYVTESLLPVRVDIHEDMPIRVRDTVLKEPEFRKLLSIQGVPAFYFFDTNGRVIGVLDSQMDLLKFKRMLVYIRDGHFFLNPFEKFLQMPAASEEAINKRF